MNNGKYCPEIVSKVERAYLAGIIDGEGYIAVYRHYQNKSGTFGYRLRVGVTNTDKDLILWLHGKFAGQFCDGRIGGEGYKPRYDVVWYSSHACKVLKLALPYLKSKKLKAEIAIEFGARKHFGQRTLDEKVYENNVFEKFKVLNKRGALI